MLADIEDNSGSDIDNHDNDLDAEPVRKDEVSVIATLWNSIGERLIIEMVENCVWSLPYIVVCCLEIIIHLFEFQILFYSFTLARKFTQM